MAPRDIFIRPALNGYVCKVGCQSLVFESRVALLAALANYLADPAQTEKEFIGKAVNRTLEQPAPPVNEPIPVNGSFTDTPCTITAGAIQSR